MIISAQARDAVRKSSIIVQVDIRFHVPEGVPTDAQLVTEIEGIIRELTLPVNEAAQAVISALMETECLRSPEAPTVIV